MRLLDTETGQFVDKDPRDSKWDRVYAILSHTWDRTRGEQTYQELRKIQDRYTPIKHQFPNSDPGPLSSSAEPQDGSSRIASPLQLSSDPSSTNLFTSLSTLPPLDPRSIWDDPELSPKIREACRVARENGFGYIWIDSCCIDKSSSSELSEAINSMYAWYTGATVCYAYLADVPAEEDHRGGGSCFRKSEWFTRGWTLQELIAPWHVVFLSKDWVDIGSKHTLVDLLEDVTTISSDALLHLEALDKFSIAQRLSWAATRRTTRIEDEAYSLFGIFDITMPTLYGEGERAFQRLQEEIMRRIPDQSLFAWRDVYLGPEILHESDTPAASSQTPRWFHCEFWRASFLAPDLAKFVEGASIKVVPHGEVSRRLQLSDLPALKYTSTPHGIRTRLPVIPLSNYFPANSTGYPDYIPPSHQWYLVILGCEHKDFPGQLLGRVCYMPPPESGVASLHCAYVKVTSLNRDDGTSDLFPLSMATIRRCQPHVEVKTVYVSQPKDAQEETPEHMRRQPHRAINLMLSKNAREALLVRGYTAHLRSPDHDHPTTHRLTLSNDRHTISIQYRHTLDDDGRRFTMHVGMKISARCPEPVTEVVDEEESSAVVWSDYLARTWFASLPTTRATSYSPGGAKVTMDLGLDFAGMGNYVLRIDEVLDESTAPASSSSPWPCESGPLPAPGRIQLGGNEIVQGPAENPELTPDVEALACGGSDRR